MTRAVRKIAGVLAVSFVALAATGCVTWLFGQSQIEADIARTLSEIDNIYQTNAETQKMIDLRLKELETKQRSDAELVMRSLAELEQRLEQIQEDLDSMRSQIDEIHYRTTGGSPDRVAIRVGSPDRGSTLVVEGNQLLLDGRKAMVRQQYEAARGQFEQFLERFPNSPRADEARMLIGDCYYRERKWAEAYKAYSLVEQMHVMSPRVPEALMKMAVCLEKLGNADGAIAALKRLITKYPEWEQIERARRMLQDLMKPKPQVPPGRPG